MAKKKETKRYRVIGPKDEDNGAEFLRFTRDNNKTALDLPHGKVITVGDELNEKEIQRLQTSNWKIEEVTE